MDARSSRSSASGQRPRGGRPVTRRAWASCGVAVTWVDNSGVTRVKAVPLAPAGARGGLGHRHVAGVRRLPGRRLDRRRPLRRRAGRRPAPAPGPGPAGRAGRAARLGLGAGRPLRPRRASRTRRTRAAWPRARSPSWPPRASSAKAAFEVEWAVGVGRRATTSSRPAPARRTGMTRLIGASGLPARPARRAGPARASRWSRSTRSTPPVSSRSRWRAEDPVGAADTFVLVRETIRATSQRHGLRASFSPKVLADGVGNGGARAPDRCGATAEPVRRRRAAATD